jgi:hypothetical protein
MLKHVGRMVRNKRKVVVAYRVVPGEADSAIVITTENLEAADHDTLMKTVESPAGQDADEFALVMARTRLSDGSNMLSRFHTTGKMVKVKQSDIEMIPNSNTTINLAELNKMIAEQKGVTVADLALKGPDGQTVQPKTETETTDPVGDYTTTNTNDSVLSDEDLAAQYRSQADAMFKEAKRLREQAEELVPTKKKTKSSAKETA